MQILLATSLRNTSISINVALEVVYGESVSRLRKNNAMWENGVQRGIKLRTKSNKVLLCVEWVRCAIYSVPIGRITFPGSNSRRKFSRIGAPLFFFFSSFIFTAVAERQREVSGRFSDAPRYEAWHRKHRSRRMNSLCSRSLAMPFRYLAEPFDPSDEIERTLSGTRVLAHRLCRLASVNHTRDARAHAYARTCVRRKTGGRRKGKKVRSSRVDHVGIHTRV